MVRLSNQLGAAPWFCMPVRATPEYAQQFAQLVKASLRPDVKIYLEVGNEMWHNGFFTGQYAMQQANLEELSRQCWVVQKTRQLSQAWQTVFATAEERARLVVVVQTQASNRDVTVQTLGCDTGLAGVDIDAFGVAPYFDGYRFDMQNVTAVLDGFATAVNETIAGVKEHKALLDADSRGFRLVAYEAGPGGSGSGGADDLCMAWRLGESSAGGESLDQMGGA